MPPPPPPHPLPNHPGLSSDASLTPKPTTTQPQSFHGQPGLPKTKLSSCPYPSLPSYPLPMPFSLKFEDTTVKSRRPVGPGSPELSTSSSSCSATPHFGQKYLEFQRASEQVRSSQEKSRLTRVHRSIVQHRRLKRSITDFLDPDKRSNISQRTEKGNITSTDELDELDELRLAMNAHLPVVRPLLCYAHRGATPMHQKKGTSPQTRIKWQNSWVTPKKPLVAHLSFNLIMSSLNPCSVRYPARLKSQDRSASRPSLCPGSKTPSEEQNLTRLVGLTAPISTVFISYLGPPRKSCSTCATT